MKPERFGHATRRCKFCWHPSGWSWSLTLQAASQFSLPSTPPTLLTPHTAKARLRPPGTPHRPLCRERTSGRPIDVLQEELPPIGCYRPVFLVGASIATRQPAVSVSPRCLVFHSRSLSRPAWWPAGTTSSDSARPLTSDNRRYGAKSYLSVQLNIGQALPVSRYACAHCCFCCCTSAHVGDGPSATTNERRFCLYFFAQASWYTKKVCMHLRDFVRTWTGLFCWEFSRKKLAIMLEITRGIFFTEKCLKFLREFEQEISQKWMDIFFPSKFPGNYLIRKGFDPELLWVL